MMMKTPVAGKGRVVERQGKAQAEWVRSYLPVLQGELGLEWQIQALYHPLRVSS